ncbi:MAG: hypothetical protein KDC38_13035, partial [Planctomycetes bacterium]|nr:hypothetical protein [Planctomycetota bacterium]
MTLRQDRPRRSSHPMQPASPAFGGRRSRTTFLGLLCVAALSLLSLSGCNNGGGGGGDDATGDVVIGLTDAEGDFLSYSVDVLAVTLTRV